MSEAYEIGIKMMMAGNVAEALGAMSSRLFGIHTKVKDIEKDLGKWRGIALGAAAAFTGIELGKGLEDIIKHGAKLEHFEAQAKAAGLSVADTGKAIAASWKNVGANINASVSESMKNILELRQVTGSVDEAIRMLPAFTRTENALASLKDDDLRGHVASKGQSYDFARSLELLAVTQDEKKLDSFVAAMTREIIGMRGLVDGHKLMIGMQNAGGARYGWSEDFVGHVFGPLIQETMRNATGLFQLDRSFGSGVMTEMMGVGAEKYGLFTKEDELRSKGHFKGMRAGSIAGYDQMRLNPEQWALDTVLPLFKSHGVDVDDTNAMAKAINEISRGNKNLNVILDALLLPANRKALAKERANIDAVPPDAATILQKNDPGQAMASFTTAWDNLLTALGKPLVHTAVVAIEDLAGGIDKLAVLAAEHPTITKLAGELTAISAGLLALAGSVAVVRLALGLGKLGQVLTGGAAAAGAVGGAAPAVGAAGGWLGSGWAAGLAAWSIDIAEQAGNKAVDDLVKKIDADKGLSNAPADVLNDILEQKANGSLSRAGYTPTSLAAEADREAARGRALNAIPPPQPIAMNTTNIFNVDGQKIAEVVIKRLVKLGGGAIQGSPYHDSTYSTTPIDFVTV
jgi:hypothetical protein